MNRRRLLLYLYSTPNLVGLALALGGLVLYFLGVIDNYWPLIVAGLYIAGVLLTPRPAARTLALSPEGSPDTVRRELDALVDSIQGRVPGDVLARVRSIRDSIVATLPADGSDPSAYADLSTIRRTALDYLPTALQNYLALPRAFAQVHPVQDGKTAHQLLLEQLTLMDDKMREIADDVYRKDTRRLIEHGYFLEERFGQQPGQVPGAS